MLLASIATCALLLLEGSAGSVFANGRVPGATGLAIHPRDGQQLLLGLTFGLALSRDGGERWSWMCEAQIEGNGSTVDPSIVLTGDGSIVVVSLTNGGILVSRDAGCSFERAAGPLQGHRGVDLTLDPSDPGRVLALMSSLVALDDAGRASFANFIAHSHDHGEHWQVLSALPDDMWVETLELAPSNPERIYVSGTSSRDPLLGVVERSDDGGRSWTRSTAELPFGSGSLFLSGIHPSDPDRLWFRLPGRGDVHGILSARLWRSGDGAVSFEPVADTPGGMLGFAVSPDGERIAFGGPLDGLHVAPADGSTAPVRVSDLPVSCLRWHRDGLYVCGLEPGAPDTLAIAREGVLTGQDLLPLWRRAQTCRGDCPTSSPLEATCGQPWEELAPLLGAESALCVERAPLADAGADAVSEGPASRSRGCAALQPPPADTGRGPWLVLLLLLSLRAPRPDRRVRTP